MLNVTNKDGIVNVQVSGLINEDIHLNKLSLNGAKGVVFDFANVDAINSIGVKMWIGYLGEIPQNVPTKYVNCPRVFVDQMNMVMGFKPKHIAVDSFFVPYYCDECSKVQPTLYNNGKEFDTSGKINHPQKVECPKCKVPMQMDVMEAKYFMFLKRK
ncbi:MAG: hypothetical protein IPM57_08295 [Oligoflexia bacterium]|nr:hypothetical protein [Oligoflexia bacterium]